MKVEAIIFCSSAGTTEKYARLLAEQSGLPVLPLKQGAKKYAGKSVLFFSWICSGVLMNYERAKKSLNIQGVCAVGIGKKEQALSDLNTNQSLSGENLFFLPGAFQMKKLNFLHRRAMKDMEYALALRVRNPKIPATPADRETYNMLRHGADYYDEAQLAPVLAWLDGNLSLPDVQKKSTPYVNPC